MTTSNIPRRLTWSMRTQNLFGAPAAVWGWALLFFSLFGVWLTPFPPSASAGWIPVSLAALGSVLVLWSVIVGTRRNHLLATGVIAPGRIVNLVPTGVRINGVPQVQVTFAYPHADEEHRVTVTVPISLRLGVQTLDAMAAALADIVRHQAARDGADAAAPHPLAQDIARLQPMDVLRRIMDEGWDAVLKGFAVRAAAVTAISAADGTAVGDTLERQASALDAQPPSTVLGTTVDSMVNDAHAKLAGHINTEHWAGQMAHNLLNGARDFAGDQTRALFAPATEIIFHPPHNPDAAMPASILGYRVERTDDGRLRGGNLLIALAVSILPTLTLVIHGIIALVRFWPR